MIRKIDFDFTTTESRQKLEFILDGSGWSGSNVLDLYREARLLKSLLHDGKLSVTEHVYLNYKNHSPEARKLADTFSHIMKKRRICGALLDMGEIFGGQYSMERDYCNSVYFPELRAYIRYDGLKPEYLLDMLGRDNCDKVIVFPGFWYSDDEGVYYTFELAVSKEDFKQILHDEEEVKTQEMYEAVKRANEKSGIVFPEVNFIE
jgi:hypothetical protein